MDIQVRDTTFTNIGSAASASLQIFSTGASTATVLCKGNHFNSPAPGLALETNLFAKATWFVVENVGHYTGNTSPLYPFSFLANSIATGTLYLVDNFASNNGYLLINSSTSTFNAASLDLSPAGLENLNTGSFTITGPITYIPFDSNLIPE